MFRTSTSVVHPHPIRKRLDAGRPARVSRPGMAKTKQLVVRIDPDLGKVLEDTAAAFNRSQAVVLCTALNELAQLTLEERRAAIVRYVTRDMPDAPPRAKTPKK